MKQNTRAKADFGKVKRDTFDFHRIERLFLMSDKTSFFQVITDRTFQDLDMNEVFMFIDRTCSKVGQQFLYRSIRTIPATNARASQFEKIIGVLKNEPQTKERVLSEIETLNAREAYYISSLFLEKHIEKPGWFWAIPILSLLSFSAALLSFFLPQMLILLILLLTVNFGIHYWNKNNLYQYASSIPQLIRLNRAAKNIMDIPVMRELDPDIVASVKAIDNLGIQMSLFKLEAKMQSEIGLMVEYFFEIIKALFLIEPLVLFNVLKQIDTKRGQIEQVFNYIGEIDSAMSIQFLRDDVPHFCFPDMRDAKKQITATDVYHPLIYNSVSNSIDIFKKSALLTGSNMSGKTTFIRTIGINAIVGQTINTCFANEFRMPVLKVHSAIRISDDLMNEKSYYFEEVLTIKTLLKESESGDGNLFLLDELFKGTNTVERIASGKAVLSYLNKENNIAFVATHDLELTELLKVDFELFHFSETVSNDQILFDYKIKPGNLTTTNAIRILQLNGYPQEITEEATALTNRISSYKMKNGNSQ